MQLDNNKILQIQKLTLYLLYCVTIIGVFFLQFYTHNASNESLIWMLKPVSIGVSLLTNHSFTFSENIGFLAENNAFTIDKSCAGINFFCMALLMVVFSFLNRFPKSVYQFFAFGNFLFWTFVITIIVNVCRIVVAVQFLSLGEKFPILATDKMHTIQGTLFYCTFLLLYYIAIHYLLKTYKPIKT